jgi:putative transposase
MQQRMALIAEYKQGESIAALAEIYGLTRKTVYKWIEREEQEGPAGLADRSRAPHYSTQRVSDEIIQDIIALRQRWGWGPRKLLVKLAEAVPGERLPAASTVAEILRSRGLSQSPKRRCRTPPYAQPFATVGSPNQTWNADFKGWFQTQNGSRCDPLTISDAHSRYLLCCQITAKTDTLHVEALFDRVFGDYGLPEVIHTDNGPPFASRGPQGLSRLSMRWLRLGIVCERSRPACPQDNGRHERMHRSLKQETLRPPAANPKRQQEVFNAWRQIYNRERPHEALDYKTPAACYQPSLRPFPRRVPEVEYDSGIFVRRISHKGELHWKNQRLFVSEIFAGECLGLRPNHDRYYDVLYGHLQVGWLDTFHHRFHRDQPRTLRKEREHSPCK